MLIHEVLKHVCERRSHHISSFKSSIRRRDDCLMQNGFTPEQRFFIAFAQSFETKYRPASSSRSGCWRRAPADMFELTAQSAMGSFAKAFNLPDNAQLMVPGRQAHTLWEVQPKK